MSQLPNGKENNENKLKKAIENIAKNKLKQQRNKLIKKALTLAAKKVGALLFSKVGLVLVIILIVILAVGLFVMLVTPNMTFEEKKPKEYEIEMTQELLQRYATLTYKHNILDVRYGLMLDMGQYENQYMLEYSADESSFMLFDTSYQEYVPPLKSCIFETEHVDEGGNVIITVTEEITPMVEGDVLPPNCEQISKKVVLIDWYFTTKEEILEFMDKKGALKIEGIKPKRKFIVDDMKMYEPINKGVEFLVVELNYIGTPIEEAIEEGKFNKYQKEHVEIVLQVPEAVDELFEEYSISILGTHLFGSGAYCVQDGVVDTNIIDNVLSKAGVLKGHTQTFIDVANKYNIDVVLMISIALHETGNGTSNAVTKKNNPAGLMNPATNSAELFIYNSLAEGIEAMGYTLNNRINKDGLTTIENLGAVYAPIGAANDPSNLNQYWVGNVGKNVAKLGGLTMNCENYTSTTITFNGDVSQARQAVASIGTRWIGNSKYVFGGGRTQADIGRGWFDCSSFVHWAYKQAGIDLGVLGNTSTETLNKIGTRISISEIQVGDLIFWDTYKKDGHVAIYIGNGQFIGAQTSNGVEIVSVNNPYWTAHFSGHVRRILD